jgi:hypothetical protein
MRLRRDCRGGLGVGDVTGAEGDSGVALAPRLEDDFSLPFGDCMLLGPTERRLGVMLDASSSRVGTAGFLLVLRLLSRSAEG